MKDSRWNHVRDLLLEADCIERIGQHSRDDEIQGAAIRDSVELRARARAVVKRPTLAETAPFHELPDLLDSTRRRS